METKKLTTEQIGYVSNYIQSFDIKWYELQVELTDHFVSIMEEIWNEDPELSFHQVKYRAEQRFGRNYFKQVVKERKKILQKEYNSKQRKMIAAYLSFPKIIGSVLLMIVIYNISFYFENTSKFISSLFLILFLFLPPFIYQYIKNRNIEGKRFLAIEYSLGYLGLFIFPQLGMNLSNLYKEEIQHNHLLVFLFICLWVLGFLFCITGIHLNNKIVANIKKQYKLI